MAKRRSEIQARYDAVNTKQYRLKLNLRLDADIIDRLDAVESKQGYIKGLIRKDLSTSPFMRAACKKDSEGYIMTGFKEEDGKKILVMAKEGDVIQVSCHPDGKVVVEKDGKIAEIFGT